MIEIIAFLGVVIPLVAIARAFGITYPVVLVLGGLVLGFVPGLPKIQFDPNVVLLIFLPPLLYWEAITAPTDIMLANAGQIGLLAFGLVAVTTAAVAALAHAIVPETSWPEAFVLGAIISPTDALAAIPILERFQFPRHVIAIIEGESLLNDATALVIFGAAVTAASDNAFRLGPLLGGFLISALGSLAVGYLAGRVAVELWRRLNDPEIQSLISVIAPFLAYFPAQKLGFSGVLAVVVAGVYANHFTPRYITPIARTQVIGFWKTVVFLANAVLFLAAGLQLHDLARVALTHSSWQLVLGYAVAVNAVVVVVRMVFVTIAEYAPTAAPPGHAAPNWKHAMIVGWSGFRGSISLAAALAIPFALPNGSGFPHRDLIIFLVFTVILFTLVAGGLTMPALVRRLRIEGAGDERDEIALALVRSNDAALQRIRELENERLIDREHAAALRDRFEHQRELQSKTQDAGGGEHASRDAHAEREVLAAQRNAIILMREHGEIDNVTLRRLQFDLDLLASRRLPGSD